MVHEMGTKTRDADMTGKAGCGPSTLAPAAGQGPPGALLWLQSVGQSCLPRPPTSSWPLAWATFTPLSQGGTSRPGQSPIPALSTATLGVATITIKCPVFGLLHCLNKNAGLLLKIKCLGMDCSILQNLLMHPQVICTLLAMGSAHSAVRVPSCAHHVTKAPNLGQT